MLLWTFGNLLSATHLLASLCAYLSTKIPSIIKSMLCTIASFVYNAKCVPHSVLCALVSIF
jgi:hypothetical protein